MSRSRKKVYLWKCNCCRNTTKDRIKDNRISRRNKKQKLNTSEVKGIDYSPELFERSIKHKTSSNYEPRYKRIKTENCVIEESKSKAKYYGKTKKEITALEKKFYYRLMSK